MSDQPIVEKVKVLGPVELVKQQSIKNPLFTIAVPVRNRYGVRVRNCLRGLELQTVERLEIIVADFGSTQINHDRLMKDLEPFDCTAYYCKTDELWSSSVARNMGIRRANAEYVASLDVDCILKPGVVEETLAKFKKIQNAFIVSRVRHCRMDLDLNSLQLPRDYEKLEHNSKLRRPGTGAYMCAPRSWWFKVQGYDERLKMWGGPDDDIKKRARSDKRKIVRLPDISATWIYHQWHPKSEPKKGAGPWRRKNRRILKGDPSIKRNGVGWGVTAPRVKKEKK